MRGVRPRHQADWGERFAVCFFLDLLVSQGTSTVRRDLRHEYDAAALGRASGTLSGAPVGALRRHGEATPARGFGLALHQLTPLHLRFLRRSHQSVRRFLRRQRGRLDVAVHSNHIVIENGEERGSLPLPRAAVERLFDEVASTFAGDEQPFSYMRIVQAVVHTSTEAVAALLDGAIPAAVIAAKRGDSGVRVTFNQMFGGAMTPYDLCMESDGANNRISLPNFAAMSPEHEAWYFRLPTQAPMQRRKHFAYLAEAVAVPCHEVFHVFQTWAGQKDSGRGSWSAEHDASVASLSLLYHIASEVPTSDDPLAAECCEMLSGGVAEAVIFEQLRQLDDCFSLMTRHEMDEFSKLRAAAGVHPPAIDADSSFTANAYKLMLPFELFTDSREILSRQIRSMFAGRLDVDTATAPPPAVPDDGVARPSHWMFNSPPRVEDIVAYLREVSDDSG